MRVVPALVRLARFSMPSGHVRHGHGECGQAEGFDEAGMLGEEAAHVVDHRWILLLRVRGHLFYRLRQQILHVFRAELTGLVRVQKIADAQAAAGQLGKAARAE